MEANTSQFICLSPNTCWKYGIAAVINSSCVMARMYSALNHVSLS